MRKQILLLILMIALCISSAFAYNYTFQFNSSSNDGFTTINGTANYSNDYFSSHLVNEFNSVIQDLSMPNQFNVTFKWKFQSLYFPDYTMVSVSENPVRHVSGSGRIGIQFTNQSMRLVRVPDFDAITGPIAYDKICSLISFPLLNDDIISWVYSPDFKSTVYVNGVNRCEFQYNLTSMQSSYNYLMLSNSLGVYPFDTGIDDIFINFLPSSAEYVFTFDNSSDGFSTRYGSPNYTQNYFFANYDSYDATISRNISMKVPFSISVRIVDGDTLYGGIGSLVMSLSNTPDPVYLVFGNAWARWIKSTQHASYNFTELGTAEATGTSIKCQTAVPGPIPIRNGTIMTWVARTRYSSEIYIDNQLSCSYSSTTPMFNDSYDYLILSNAKNMYNYSHNGGIDDVSVDFNVSTGGCDFSKTEVRNCDILDDVEITGEHYVANLSITVPDVNVYLTNAVLRYNDSWGYKLNNVATNDFFLLKANNPTITGDGNSVLVGKTNCDGGNSYGTNAMRTYNVINTPTVRNLKFEDHLADFRFHNARYGSIENNILNHTDNCHPIIYGTGNHTNITNNDLKGNIEIFGGETNIVGNRLLDEVDENCDGMLFRITNTAWWESTPQWYGRITDNDFGWDCFGWDVNIRVNHYTGDGFNVTNNKNFMLNWYDAMGGYGNEYVYNNSDFFLYFESKPENVPVVCVDGVYNGWLQVGIYHEGNWNMKDWMCAGDTEMKDFSLTIQTSNVSFTCGDVVINNLDNPGYQPLQIWGASWAEGSRAQDNVSVENCKLWNSYGNAMSIQVGDAWNITNIHLKDIETISNAESIYLWGVNGLYLDNVTGKDCGAGFSVFDGIEFGVSDTITNNVFINNSNFTGGACKGYGSTFQGLNSGLTIENSVFDTTEAGVQTISAFGAIDVNIHDNQFLGGQVQLIDLSGMFYDNVVDTELLINNNLDICNGGIGNTIEKLSIGDNGNILLDNACNPLVIPDGISVRNLDYLNSSILFNGNGVTLTGTGNVGINVSGTDADVQVVDSTIQNIIVSGFTKSILLNAFTRGNLMKDMLLLSGYEDNGVDNTFTNITLFCTENWLAYYTACLPTNNQTLYYLDDNACGTFGDLPLNNGTSVACTYSLSGGIDEVTGFILGLFGLIIAGFAAIASFRYAKEKVNQGKISEAIEFMVLAVVGVIIITLIVGAVLV